MDGIIPVDKNLNGSMIRKVKSERRMRRRLSGSPKDFANDFAGVNTGTELNECNQTVKHENAPDMIESQRLRPSANGSGRGRRGGDA